MTPNQADNTSLDDQKTKILSYGAAMGREVVECFSEVASGKQMGNRTAIVAAEKRRWVDVHTDRGMSYVKIGCQWVKSYSHSPD
jgi:hypothetical protein